MDFKPPFALDNAYRMIRKVGEGSYGSVWLALDSFHRWVAVKVVLRQPGRERVFEREFSGLDLYDRMPRHEGLVRVFKPGRDETEGYFYYAMEVADDARTRRQPPQPPRGDTEGATAIAAAYEPLTLASLLRQGHRLPPGQVFLWGEALASALQHLHERGAVHRDIKPSNILIIGGRPRLADIGLLVEAESGPCTLAGTVGYVPLHGANERSGDIYALGLVLYQMATGRQVFEYPIEAQDLGTLPQSEVDALNELQAIYDNAAHNDPGRRPACAAELVAEIKLAAAGELREWRRDQTTATLRQVRRKELRRRLLWISLGVTIVGFLLLSFIVARWRESELAARAQIAELGELRFSRIGSRVNGWSRLERERIREAHGKIPPMHLESYALLAMAGLDAVEVGHWSGEAASHAAFHPTRSTAYVVGQGRAPSRVLGCDRPVEIMPVAGPGRVFWTGLGEPRCLVLRDGAPIVVDGQTGMACLRLERLQGSETIHRPSLPIWTVSRAGGFAAASTVTDGSRGLAVWDLSNGSLVGRVQCQVTAVEISPDDQLLAIGREDGSVAVHRLPGLTLVQTLPGAAGCSRVQALAFAPDLTRSLGSADTGSGWCLAVGDHGAGVVVWRLGTGVLQSFCRGALWEVSALTFLQDGITLVSGGRLGLRFWDSTTGELLLETHGPGDDTEALAASADGSMLLAGSRLDSASARTLLLRLEEGRGIQSLRGLRGAPRLIRFSDDSRWIAALDDNWRLGLWDSHGNRLHAVIESPAAAYADTAALCFSPDGAQLAFAANGRVSLLSVSNGATIQSWPVPVGQSDGLAALGQGAFAHAVCSRDGDVSGKLRWSLRHLRVGQLPLEVARQGAEDGECLSIAMGPSMKMLAIERARSAQATHLRLVDARDGSSLWRRPVAVPFHWETPRLDPTGDWLLLGEGTPRTRLTRLEDGVTISELPSAISISPDRSWLTSNHELRRIRTPVTDGLQMFLLLSRADASMDPIPLGSDATVVSYSSQFSPDGRSIAWGDERGVLSFARIEALVDDLVDLGTRPDPKRR